jgi:DNA-binding response OmpR family regulator
MIVVSHPELAGISRPGVQSREGISVSDMRILLIEDEEKVARVVERGLKAELYAVDVAGDGKTAFACLRANSYELVILDLNLPDISGTEILTHIRQNHGSLPVLVVTARDALEDKVENFERGADDYLTKPFSFTELALRVKALLRRGQHTARPDVLQIGDLQLDKAAHQVKRGKHTLVLTAKEFALLEYLMSHPGRVLSRTMIMENVWDQSFEGLTNIVDVYIAQLRKKIDDSFEKKMLRTVRGVGYSLQEEAE